MQSWKRNEWKKREQETWISSFVVGEIVGVQNRNKKLMNSSSREAVAKQDDAEWVCWTKAAASLDSDNNCSTFRVLI